MGGLVEVRGRIGAVAEVDRAVRAGDQRLGVLLVVPQVPMPVLGPVPLVVDLGRGAAAAAGEILPRQHAELIELGEGEGQIATHDTPSALLGPPDVERLLVGRREFLLDNAVTVLLVIEVAVHELRSVVLAPHDPRPDLILDLGTSRLRDPLRQEPDAIRTIVVDPSAHPAIMTRTPVAVWPSVLSAVDDRHDDGWHGEIDHSTRSRTRTSAADRRSRTVDKVRKVRRLTCDVSMSDHADYGSRGRGCM